MNMDRTERMLIELARQLKTLRQTKGLSHDTLARRAGLTRPAISHIESGKRKPSLKVSIKLAHALDTELSELLRAIELITPKI
jgi:putative molybdopterin biosynthesis protein